MVAAESLWSKSLHEAVFHLDRYAETGSPNELDAFRERMGAIEAHQHLRGLMASGERVDEATAAALVRSTGQNAQDAPGILDTVYRFRNRGFVKRTLERWEATDAPVESLMALAGRIEAEWRDGAPNAAAIAAARAEMVTTRAELRPLADAFAASLGNASNLLANIIRWMSLVIVLALSWLGITLGWSVLHRASESEQRFRHLLNTANDGIIAVSPVSGRILGCNHKMSQMVGRQERSLIGRLYVDLFPVAERERLMDANKRLLDGLHGLNLLHRDGRVMPVEVSASYTLWDSEEALIAIMRDATERRAHERRIEFLASHDSLTGLINRREFERRAENILGDRRRGEHALMYIDLNQFKVVNDTCGHAAGDEMLRQLTTRLRRSVRDSDTLARLGGDEFGVLLEDCSLEQAEQVAAKIVTTINGWHFTWGGRRFGVGASIGLVPIQPGGPGLTPLMSAADAACYAAKEGGRNRVVVYRPGDSDLLTRQSEMDWVARLTDALAERRFELHCQRIVNASGGSADDIEHNELLVRLRERDDTLILPRVFLPAAERFNLAATIDRHIIECAVHGLRKSLDAGATEQAMFGINITGSSIANPEFAEFVGDVFKRWQVPTKMVCFEISEAAAFASLEASRSFITRMRALGIRIALDDFGTGLSSFSYLRTLPVDYLKIDGSFMKDLSEDPVSTAMVQAIYELSKVIGIRTIAESVENEESLARLRDIGGGLAQGYALHRPERWEWSS